MEFSGTWKEIWTQKGEMPGTKEDIRVYDGWEKSATEISFVADKIKDILDIKSTDNILEVGCGGGGIAQYINANYIGIDFSKPLTEKCMEFFNKPAIYAEANNLPFKEKYFDKTFAWGVFLYFPDKNYMLEAVKEMKRVTKKAVFIGDLPKISHSKRHMIYDERDFIEMDFTVMPSWAEPYVNDRFCALWVNA